MTVAGTRPHGPDALRATGLVKDFDGTRAIDGVDLRVAAGEVRGVLGPNGAGKTTLLRMLFGLIAADRGQIELLGRPLDADRPAALEGIGRVRRGAGVLPVSVGARQPRAARASSTAPAPAAGSSRRSSACPCMTAPRIA